MYIISPASAVFIVTTITIIAAAKIILNHRRFRGGERHYVYKRRARNKKVEGNKVYKIIRTQSPELTRSWRQRLTSESQRSRASADLLPAPPPNLPPDVPGPEPDDPALQPDVLRSKPDDVTPQPDDPGHDNKDEGLQQPSGLLPHLASMSHLYDGPGKQDLVSHGGMGAPSQVSQQSKPDQLANPDFFMKSWRPRVPLITHIYRTETKEDDKKNFYFCHALLAGDRPNPDQATALSWDSAAEEAAIALSPLSAQSKDRETPVK